MDSLTGAGAPPQNIDVEASLLGSLLIDSDSFIKVGDMILAEDFFDERHKTIFTAMRFLHDKRAPVDILTLSDQLRAKGQLDMVGGASYLTELTNFVPTAAHLEQYAQIVADKAIRRRLRDLDKLLAGLQRSDLIVIAARPSMGKTAMMLNMSLNIATKAEQGAVLYFSLEMGKEQLVDRLLAAEAGVDAWKLRTGEGLTDEDFEKLSAGMGSLAEAPIFIDDTSGITVSDLRTKARRLHHRHPLAVIMVDYLQLMSGGSRFASMANRVQEITEISRSLKILARELNVPIVAASQLSRSVENRSPQIPQLADLRESGSIEQDADIVAFLYREEYYNPESDRKNITDILVKKHRNGPVANIELYFDRIRQRFRDLDTKHGQPFDS
jgi:replicative DNA helicase